MARFLAIPSAPQATWALDMADAYARKAQRRRVRPLRRILKSGPKRRVPLALPQRRPRVRSGGQPARQPTPPAAHARPSMHACWTAISRAGSLDRVMDALRFSREIDRTDDPDSMNAWRFLDENSWAASGSLYRKP